MNKRMLPASEKFASCPNEGNILEYYDGQFECVYVLLSPFMRPTSVSTDRFCPEKWPSKQELIEGVSPVSWKEIIELTALNSIDEVDIALRTSIGGLKKKFENEKLSNILCQLTESDNIIHPSEGDVSPLIENTVYDSLQAIGQEWLWVGDEFCTERKLTWIEDLKGCNEAPSHACFFTPDKKVLITTHWDSHFSFLCSSKSTIEQILKYGEFEGFYCTSETEVYWSVNRK